MCLVLLVDPPAIIIWRAALLSDQCQSLRLSGFCIVMRCWRCDEWSTMASGVATTCPCHGKHVGQNQIQGIVGNMHVHGCINQLSNCVRRKTPSFYFQTGCIAHATQSIDMSNPNRYHHQQHRIAPSHPHHDRQDGDDDEDEPAAMAGLEETLADVQFAEDEDDNPALDRRLWQQVLEIHAAGTGTTAGNEGDDDTRPLQELAVLAEAEADGVAIEAGDQADSGDGPSRKRQRKMHVRHRTPLSEARKRVISAMAQKEAARKALMDAEAERDRAEQHLTEVRETVELSAKVFEEAADDVYSDLIEEPGNWNGKSIPILSQRCLCPASFRSEFQPLPTFCR